MRLLIYGLILMLLLYTPVQRLDVAKLEPVEVVYMDIRDSAVVLTTDTEAWGRGEDPESALEDMRSRTPGVIYLDTAEFLLVTQAAADQVDGLRPYLKETVLLCATSEADLEGMAKYLEVHGDLPMLKEWKQGENLPLYKDGKIIE